MGGGGGGGGGGDKHKKVKAVKPEPTYYSLHADSDAKGDPSTHSFAQCMPQCYDKDILLASAMCSRTIGTHAVLTLECELIQGLYERTQRF